MIHDFVASWSLFRDSYLAGWLLALLLPMLGVLVVARDQIFVGAAVSQASLLGIASALRAAAWLSLAGVTWLDGDLVVSVSAGAFAILAALATAGGAGRGDSHESITGFVFLVSSSAAVLLMAHSPHGMEEINRLLSSTLIGATPVDVGVFALLLTLTAVTLALRGAELVLVVMDHEMAEAVGVRVDLWNGVLAVWLGLVVGLSNRVAGAIFTFGCLVLPALAARSFCREVRAMLWVAPVASLATAGVAFVVAHDLDFPPGQTTAFAQCMLLVAAWAARFVRARRGGA
ncbi:metal ABC transporter permease [Candidatus Binatia bacterium]|nr:metal ABC transporter permease [Candidatus Binatia bacterium]